MGKYFSKAKLCQMELTVVQWEETPWAEREVSLSHQTWQGLRMEEWRASTQGQTGLLQGQAGPIQGQAKLHRVNTSPDCTLECWSHERQTAQPYHTLFLLVL